MDLKPGCYVYVGLVLMKGLGMGQSGASVSLMYCTVALYVSTHMKRRELRWVSSLCGTECSR